MFPLNAANRVRLVGTVRDELASPIESVQDKRDDLAWGDVQPPWRDEYRWWKHIQKTPAQTPMQA